MSAPVRVGRVVGRVTVIEVGRYEARAVCSCPAAVELTHTIRYFQQAIRDKRDLCCPACKAAEKGTTVGKPARRERFLGRLDGGSYRKDGEQQW